MTLDTSTHKYQTIPCEAWTPNDWADWWRFEIGVNIIPADVGHTDKNKRKPLGLELCNYDWLQWKTKPIPIELHESWKKDGYFNKGLAVICGKTFHRYFDYYLNGIDCVDDFTH